MPSMVRGRPGIGTLTPNGRMDYVDLDNQLANYRHRGRGRGQYPLNGTAGRGRMSSAGGNGGDYNGHRGDESDEDTEDASEDGGIQQIGNGHQEIREQVYQDRLEVLKAHLEDLERGSHKEFNRRLGKLEKDYTNRTSILEASYEHELEWINKECFNDRLVAQKEFEQKKNELRDNLVIDLEEKKKLVEQIRLDVVPSSTEVKPASTRKNLRRRPHEPAQIPEKRRKILQSQVAYLLDDKDIDEDLQIIASARSQQGEASHSSESDS